jgi:hypothetical protein
VGAQYSATLLTWGDVSPVRFGMIGVRDVMAATGPGEQPGQRADEGTVCPGRPRACNLSTQDAHLMAQHQDLRSLGCLQSHEERNPGAELTEDQVHQPQPVPRPVDFCWPWGDALPVLDEVMPDLRAVNLETSITSSNDFAAAKAIHYRMNPANLPCLQAVSPDVCVLANNHVMDFGRRGLEETLDVLAEARLRSVGAGRDARQAQQPAVVNVEENRIEGNRRVLVFSGGDGLQRHSGEVGRG